MHPDAPRKLLKWDTEDEARVPRAPKTIVHSGTVTELTANSGSTKRDISNKSKNSLIKDGKLFQVVLE